MVVLLPRLQTSSILPSQPSTAVQLPSVAAAPTAYLLPPDYAAASGSPYPGASGAGSAVLAVVLA